MGEDLITLDTKTSVNINKGLLQKFQQYYPAHGFFGEVVRQRIRELVRLKEETSGNRIVTATKQTSGTSSQVRQVSSSHDTSRTAGVHKPEAKELKRDAKDLKGKDTKGNKKGKCRN